MSDAFHPNNYGHCVFANYLFKELGIFDAKSTTCSFSTPERSACVSLSGSRDRRRSSLARGTIRGNG